MRLRQVCLVVRELEPAVSELRQVLELAEGYRDDGVSMWGLENAVMLVGHDFVEVVAPTRPDTAAGRYLDRRGAGGYMVILQAEEGLLHRKRLTERGVRSVFTADRDPDIWITQYHPADCGKVFLEIDSVNPEFDHLDPDCPWPPAGKGLPAAGQSGVVDHFVALNLQDDNPRQMGLLWSDLLDQPVFDHESFWQVKLQNAVIRFQDLQDARGPGMESLDLGLDDLDGALERAEARDLRTGECQVVLCGMKMNLLDARNL